MIPSTFILILEIKLWVHRIGAGRALSIQSTIWHPQMNYVYKAIRSYNLPVIALGSMDQKCFQCPGGIWIIFTYSMRVNIFGTY